MLVVIVKPNHPLKDDFCSADILELLLRVAFSTLKTPRSAFDEFEMGIILRLICQNGEPSLKKTVLNSVKSRNLNM
jgi:hypothetical protein